MYRINWISLLIVLLLFPAISSATTTRELANGITFVTIPDHTIPIVSLSFLIPGGVVAQAADNSVATLTYSLLAEGTERFSKQEIYSLEETGGSIGAAASLRSGSISATVLRADATRATTYLISMFQEATLNPTRFPVLQQQVLAAIANRQSSPAAYGRYLFEQERYRGTPRAMSAHGDHTLTAALTIDDIQAYYNKYVQQTVGAVFIVSGDIDTTMESEISASLDALPRKEATVDAQHDFPEPPLASAVPAALNQAQIFVSYRAPLPHEACFFPAKVLSAVLGGGMSSRLFGELRKKQGLAYSVHAGFGTETANPSFDIVMGTSQEKFITAIEGIATELRRITAEVPDEAEVERARNYIIGNFAMAHESAADVARFKGLYELMGLGIAFDDTYSDGIAAVTPEQVHTCAQTLFAQAPALLAYGVPQEVVLPPLSLFGFPDTVGQTGTTQP